MKKEENFLDYIPKRNQRFAYQTNEKGYIEIAVLNTGFMNRVLQLVCKKPKISYVELEEMGSFLWEQMDGIKTVYELGVLEKQEFGEKAEPIYERLCTYLKVLRKSGFIIYVNKT